MKTFAQYCTYVRKGKGIVLEPAESLGTSSWLVVFCDEINLPEEDSYGTQRVIMFMRQLVEQGEWTSFFPSRIFAFVIPHAMWLHFHHV
jgi:dynein heavy chain 1